MARPKLPPRLLFDAGRGTWYVRYENCFKRTPFREDQRAEAQDYLDKVLRQSSWVRGLRRFEPNLRAGPRFTRSGTIYFLSREACNEYPIKIGFCAGNLERRIIDIQTGNPEKLAVLLSLGGDWKLEQKVHSILSAHRLEGEWFRRSEPVLDALEQARAGTLAVWADGHQTSAARFW